MRPPPSTGREAINPEAKSCWIAGFSFGAWIGMQPSTRRPEIEGFISICPPANLYDFSFLAPCPSSGLSSTATRTRWCPQKDVTTLVDKLKTQEKGIIEQKVIPGANPSPRQGGAAAYEYRRLSRQAPQDRAQADRGRLKNLQSAIAVDGGGA